MLKMIIVAFLLVLAASVPVIGNEELGIHGATIYRVDVNGTHEFTVDLRYNFTDWFAIGFTEITYSGEWRYYYGFPSFIPEGQFYDFYFAFTFFDNSVFIKTGQWCTHPVVGTTLNAVDESKGSGGLYAEFGYKF